MHSKIVIIYLESFNNSLFSAKSPLGWHSRQSPSEPHLSITRSKPGSPLCSRLWLSSLELCSLAPDPICYRIFLSPPRHPFSLGYSSKGFYGFFGQVWRARTSKSGSIRGSVNKYIYFWLFLEYYLLYSYYLYHFITNLYRFLMIYLKYLTI